MIVEICLSQNSPFIEIKSSKQHFFVYDTHHKELFSNIFVFRKLFNLNSVKKPPSNINVNLNVIVDLNPHEH